MADDAHRPLDDLARGGFRQKIGLSEHARLPAEGENAGLLYAIWRGRLTGTAATSRRDHIWRENKTPGHRPGVMHKLAINRGWSPALRSLGDLAGAVDFVVLGVARCRFFAV